MTKKGWLILGIFAALAIFGGETMVNETVNENAVQRLANAIANQEGYNLAGSRARRNNNPGNITDDFGFPTTGMDTIFPIFMTPVDGWDALKHFLRMILSGRSHIYTPDMTIYEMARHYTTTQQEEWAENVANHLGVSVATQLNQIV